MRSGLGAQLGLATEEEYGVFKAPSRFFPFESESLALDKNRIKSGGLRAGRFAQFAKLNRATTRTVAGDFVMNLFDQGMGVLFNQLHGETIVPAKQAEKSEEVFKQVHPIGLSDPFDKSMTVQVGRTDTGDTANAFSYLGCKLVEVKISVDAQGLVMITCSVDGQDEDLEEELGEAAYDADAQPYAFDEVAAEIESEAAANVRSMEWTIAIGQNTERYNLGNSGVKDQPIVNEFIEITCDATLEFATIEDHKRYTEEGEFALAMSATGAEIGEEGEKFKFSLAAPTAIQEASSPTVDGPDIITQDVTFTCNDDGSEAPLTATILSTDSAI